MLDTLARQWIDPPLNALARALPAQINANAVTVAGLGFGLGGAALVALGWPGLALVGLAVSRLCDGLDGPIARRTSATDRGAYLDIVCDFIFYGAWPLAFALNDPSANALAACVLLASFYFNGASFLAFAIFAAKRGMETRAQGHKSLFFSAGLAEGTETIAVFVAMCLWPQSFVWLALGFALICVLTALCRMVLAWRVFG